ncbi:NUDIX hydrolase [Nocardioides hwasunensis]|uniref:NUDIX domain-containing protein n=1 Tax=Nocardioides hwasunensis TaxID=397258 RepID=A0ABR8MIJ1_9ACTN|nr:NUDIX domain-containing protein [Nocardioides hwasunensis]MBD3915882.1 NUDIX domain-containing protein [Nocardioides hwasunensis]
MNPDLHASAVAVLAGWTPPSPGQEALRERYLTHLAAHSDGLAKACFPDHLTAGAIVVSPGADAVLLNHHRKAGAWLAFGGHLEPGDASLADGARRELVEESGLTVFDFDPEPLSLDAHAVEFCSERGTVHHLDVRFLAVADPDGSHATSDESLDVRWWPVDALPETFEDMYALIDVAVARVRDR